jgi:outer membrane protein insertion porin family
MFLRYASRVLATLCLCCPAVFLGQSVKQKSEHPEITKLTFKGVHAIELDELTQKLAVSQSHCSSILLKPFCLFSKSPIFYQKAYLDRKELARDMFRAQVLYFEHGYRQATVDTTIVPDGEDAVHVTFTVREGPPTKVTAVRIVQTDTVLSKRALRRRNELEAGDPLDLFRLDSTRVSLQRRLWNRGYSDAIVDTAITLDPAAHTALVTITLDPRWRSHIVSLNVTGNEKVDTSTILKSLRFKPGDLYRQSSVLYSQQSLYESGLFRRAEIDVQSTDDSLKHVLVAVQEAPENDAQLSLGFSTVDFFQFGAQYTNYNFFGKARRLNLQGSVGNLFASSLNGRGIFYNIGDVVVGGSKAGYLAPTFTVSGEVRQPWFLSPDNEIAVGAFAHRRSSPGIYIDRGYGFTGTFTRTLAHRTPLSLTYRFEVTDVDAGDVYFCVNYGVCDLSTLGALHRNQRLSPLALSASFDRTDHPYLPRRGMRGQADFELATAYTASDFRYDRAAVEASAFLPVARRSTIGFHIRLGYVHPLASTASAVGIGSEGTDVLHPRKRFYSGGSQSVRGFAEGQLGPRVLTVPASKLREDTVGCAPSVPIQACDPNAATFTDRDFEPRPVGGDVLVEGTVEFRFPLFEGFSAATFVDAGYVAQHTSPNIQKSKAAVTPGVGVRYQSPVGPIRVDVGINPITTETLPVITEATDSTGKTTLVRLDNQRSYSPVKPGLRGIFSRLTLHLSIGEAF